MARLFAVVVIAGCRFNPPASEPETNDARPIDGPVDSPSLDQSLVGWWMLDEGTGLVANPVRGEAGALGVGTGWGVGHAGTAVTFDGALASVAIPSYPAITNLQALTIALWVNVGVGTTPVNQRRIVAKERGHSTEDGRWVFFLNDSCNALDPSTVCLGFDKSFKNTDLSIETATSVVPRGAWHHVAVTWDGSPKAENVRFYVDGASVAADPNPGNGNGVSGPDASYPLTLGNSGDLMRDFAGALDDVRIYNRVLSDTDVAQVASE